MHHITLIGDSRANPAALRRQLAGTLEINFVSLEEALNAQPGLETVVDINLQDDARLPLLKEWLGRKPAHAKAIFITDKTSHLQQTRAVALGATDVLYRPLDTRALLGKLWGDVSTLSADPANAAIRKEPAVATAVDTLRNIFASACMGEIGRAHV